jgi:hypothetical protein
VRASHIVAIIATIGVMAFSSVSCTSMWSGIWKKLRGARTVEEVLADMGPAAVTRLEARFAAVKLSYPPSRAILVTYKRERALELWAPGPAGNVLVHAYPVIAASGTPGPKLREGDMQVPEGIYSVMELEPNSSYYLGIKINYPNSTDLANARLDRRTNLGGDIYIHGRDYSEGCLAVGDRAIEELFTLAARTGIGNITVIIGPQRFEGELTPGPGLPGWTGALYGEISRRILSEGLKERP